MDSLSCRECTLFYEKQGKIVDCEERRASGKCRRPILNKSNTIVYSLIQRYSPLFVVEGGINAEGIRLALELEEIPSGDYATVTLKIIDYVLVALSKSQEKLNKG